MSKLQPPDSHHLSAALGWLELGNPIEAAREIDKISPAMLEQPDVLEVCWEIAAAARNWKAGLQIADALLSVAQDRHSGWVHRAYALRRVEGGGLKQAWEALRPAFEKFPKTPIIPFNLACYAAQMGRLEEAWDWLHKAMEAAGDVQSIKQMALKDNDLAPLWERLGPL